MNELAIVLERSAAFLKALMEQIAAAEHFGGEDERQEAAIAAAEVAIEHGTALSALFDIGMANSAVALLRLQYEALLRSAWLLVRGNGHPGREGIGASDTRKCYGRQEPPECRGNAPRPGAQDDG